VALLEVGRVVRPHGLSGEVVVALVTNRLERIATGSVLVGSSPDGDEVPMEVTSSRPHQGRHLVHFRGVVGREAAESIRGVVLFAEAVQDPAALFVHDLIGRELIDQHGRSHGAIRAVEANPASDLLVLDEGYVPLTFVAEVSGDVVVAELPEGLLG
jgi:16S rRNA processing protein RimM